MSGVARVLAFALAALVLSAPAAAGNDTDEAWLAHGVLLQLNDIRVAHGLAPLALDPRLTAAAAGHTSEMLADGYFGHDSHDGAAFWTRLRAYTSTAPHHGWSVGENLLWSAPSVDAAQALKLWMASPEHRANILNAKWRQVGIAAMHSGDATGAYDDQPVTVITTDFGVLL